MKASANKRKFEKKIVRKETRAYQGRLQEEINETIERVFADVKEKHGMRWTTLWGLKKLLMQAMLTFAAMNLKKIANWT
ncbi:transposase [Peribacillus butanolivorans]|uniref:transposase n=1 Tax=Peribacillus butanolivorans TaxID=421767 RepID=UPI003D02F04D